MKKLHTLRLSADATAIGLSAGAQAMPWNPSWAFSGFGTPGYARTGAVKVVFSAE